MSKNLLNYSYPGYLTYKIIQLWNALSTHDILNLKGID